MVFDKVGLVHSELVVEPGLPIVDAHHHLFPDSSHPRYYPTESLVADIQSGHNIVATVYMECGSRYFDDGAEQLRSVGETEWVVSQTVPPGAMARIVGFADVRLGSQVRGTLEAHREAGQGRFRGIRYSAAWDPSEKVLNGARNAPPGQLRDAHFQEGVRIVGQAGLVFETWVYFHQLDDVLDLARAAPETQIVLNHLGGPAGAGPYDLERDEVRRTWRTGIKALSGQENVVIKIGGIGFQPFIEPSFLESLNSSKTIANYWRPEVEFAIESFGPTRCMAESNYPVDSYLCDYVTLWNSLKLMTQNLSTSERGAVFAGTAKRIYELEEA
jgi:L-fuconolactonase